MLRIGNQTQYTRQLPAESAKSAMTGAGVFSQSAHGTLIPRPGSTLEALDMLEQWRTLEERARKKATRWRAEAMPIGVYIQPNPAQPSLHDELFRVLRQWEAASLGLIRFQQMSHPFKSAIFKDGSNTSGITIVWQDETVIGRDFEVGHTHKDVAGDWIQSATITLIRTPVIDGFLSKESQAARLHTTVLHEVGHALGLEHSESKSDIMHHRGWQNRTLSLNDAQRIQNLYQLTPLSF